VTPTAPAPGFDMDAMRGAIARFVVAACESSPGAGRSKDDDVYARVTQRRDVGAMRRRYSSCGDLGNAVLASCGIAGANRSPGWRVGRNISALAWHPLATIAGTSWQPGAGDVLLIWNLPSTADAHCCVLTETPPDATPHEIAAGNYGAGGMSAAASPGANVSRRWLRRDHAGRWFYGNKRVQRVITAARIAAAATRLPDLDTLT
jgi:hypothetical protein